MSWSISSNFNVGCYNVHTELTTLQRWTLNHHCQRLVYATTLITHRLLPAIRDLGPAYSKVLGHNHFLFLPPHSFFTWYESKELLKIVSIYCQVMRGCLSLLPFLIVWRSSPCLSRKERVSLVRLRKGSQDRSTACISQPHPPPTMGIIAFFSHTKLMKESESVSLSGMSDSF